MTSDYKKYSLEKLQEWVHDAIDGDASPHEIYSAIREVVREDYYYHKERLSRASALLELLSGHRPVKDESEVNKWNEREKHYYSEEYKGSTVSSVSEDKVKKWILPVEEVRDEDTDKDEYCITFPDDLLEAANLKENDVIEWVDQGDGSYLLKKHVERYRF
jgi:hypothetical protein